MDQPNIVSSLNEAGFVEAINRNGEPQTIPVAWLDDEFIGPGFRLSPRQIELDARAGDYPTEEWTKGYLEDFARSKHIAVEESDTKKQIWDKISDVLAEGRAALGQESTWGGLLEISTDLSAELLETRERLALAELRIAELEAEKAASSGDPQTTTSEEHDSDAGGDPIIDPATPA